MHAGYKGFVCSTQIKTKLQLLIKTKLLISAFKLSDGVRIMLIYANMSTIAFKHL